ncbi:hypothetical protein LJB88_02965 [Erysipelotrichaceae bacterium OttesenSCG-928-M19]|nr:hypothetical protein [Erysipelotrichaceae bacterium OttesenSCG-928-M19]
MKRVISCLIIGLSFSIGVNGQEVIDYGLYEYDKTKEIIFLEKEVVENNGIVIEATDFIMPNNRQVSDREVIELAQAKAIDKETSKPLAIKIVPYASKCVVDCNEQLNNYLLTVKDTSVTITSYSNIPDTTIVKVNTGKNVNVKIINNLVNGNNSNNANIDEQVIKDKLKEVTLKDVKWQEQDNSYEVKNNLETNFLIILVVTVVGLLPLTYWLFKYKKLQDAVKKIIYLFFNS